MAIRALPGQGPIEHQTMRFALEILAPDRAFGDELAVDPDKLPLFDRKGRRMEKAFVHTPEPLLRSWRSARQLMAATEPGDVILTSDRHGLLGVFSLIQFALAPEDRRVVWSLAADSLFLELRLVAAAHSGLPAPLEHIVDWEIVQYRYSNRVLATSTRAQLELFHIGVEADLLTPRSKEDSPPISRRLDRWWVPGAVSRRNQSGEVLRALTSSISATATLSIEDAPDNVWDGSTWDALSHSREVLGERVARRTQPEPLTEAVVIGDPYAPPDQQTLSLVSQGVPVVIPADSTSAQVWPNAPVWETADDLTRVLAGQSEEPQTSSHRESVPSTRSRSPITSRAQRVSIGVPVFRDVRFLDECIQSLLSQQLEPFEIIIIDDGSESERVGEAIQTWSKRDSRIHVVATPHRGVCVARNTALDLMTGDSFVFIDSDDYLEPDHLAKCSNFLRDADRCWAVATWTRFFGSYEGVEAKPPFDARVGLRENPIVSTTALVDMEVRELGLRYERDLAFLFCEDWHFWSQIVAAGGEIGLVPEVLANHRVHPSSGGHLRTELAHSLGRTRATQPITG